MAQTCECGASMSVNFSHCAECGKDMSTCQECEGEGTLTCESCSGSGEGMHDGTTCRTCKGNGEVPCECQADRLKDEADAKDAAAEAKADARRDGD